MAELIVSGGERGKPDVHARVRRAETDRLLHERDRLFRPAAIIEQVVAEDRVGRGNWG